MINLVILIPDFSSSHVYLFQSVYNLPLSLHFVPFHCHFGTTVTFSWIVLFWAFYQKYFHKYIFVVFFLILEFFFMLLIFFQNLVDILFNQIIIYIYIIYNIIYLYMYSCFLHVYLSTMCMYYKQKTARNSPGIGVMHDYEPPCRCWRLIPNPIKYWDISSDQTNFILYENTEISKMQKIYSLDIKLLLIHV